MNDIEDIDDIPAILVKFSLNFTSIRVFDNTIYPCEMSLKSDVLYLEDDDAVDDYALKLALMKVHFFFDEIVSRGIMWGADNEWAANTFITDDGKNVANNIPIITPFEPSDEHLAAVFQSKMNALAGGHLAFETVELSSKDAGGLSFMFVGDSGLILPTMEEWIGKHSYFDEPWWMRNDASTMDVIPDDDADLTIKPAFAYSLDFLGESLKPTEITNAKIIRPDFKPTVIKGGKKDK